MKKIAVIGLSSFGLNIVKTLANRKVEIIAIDKNRDKVNQVKDLATRAITTDATLKENLAAVGLADVDHAIVSAGPNLEPSIIIVLLLKEMGIDRIIAKALSEEHQTILERVGASEVSFPEREVAQKIANRLIYDNMVDYIPLESGYVIEEMVVPDNFNGQSLAQVDLRKKFNVTVLAIKSIIPEQTHPNPDGGFILKESDIMIVFGTEKDIHNLHQQTT